MSSTKITYEIIDPQTNFGEGDISSISQTQNGHWRSLINTLKVTIKCGFKYWTQLASLQLKIKDADIVQIRGYQHNNNNDNITKLFQQQILIKNKQKQTNAKGIPVYYKFQSQVPTPQLHIILHSNLQKRIEIDYLSFHGSIDYSKPNNNLNRNNKKIRKRQVRQYFSDDDFNNDGIQQKQQQQLAMIQNIKNTIMKNNNNNNRENQPLPIPKSQYLLYNQDDIVDDLDIKSQNNNNTKINTVTFQMQKQKISKIFNGISDAWLLAQKKMQYNNNIPVQYQLSVFINPKCYQKQLFCLNLNDENQKKNIIRKIRQLGGFIREQPCPQCYLVSHRMEGKLVQLAKLMSNVRFVKPDYIEHCYKAKSLLGIKNYNIK